MTAEVKTTYSAIAAYSAKEELKPFTYTPLPLGPNDVEIKIQACGVCHSDLHQVHNDWKVANFPLVVGHEIVGEVIAVGSAVTTLRIGQRVGVGPQTGSCGTCRECTRGEPQHCAKKLKSYNSATGSTVQPFTYGGFASHIRTNADWAFPIPDGLSAVGAAPLLCAGITTWTPFVHNGVKAGDRVGIIGFGGLGHVAIQFSVKMGCHTTCISTSADKAKEAAKFGAQSFINVSDAKEMSAAAGTFDFLLATISANGVNWEQYFNLLRPDGKLCVVGLPTNMSFNPNKLVQNRLTLCGSYLASNKEVRSMLEFCAKHNIVAQTEELEMTPANANRALAKVEDNSARFRMVLVNPNTTTTAATATANATA